MCNTFVQIAAQWMWFSFLGFCCTIQLKLAIARIVMWVDVWPTYTNITVLTKWGYVYGVYFSPTIFLCAYDIYALQSITMFALYIHTRKVWCNKKSNREFPWYMTSFELLHLHTLSIQTLYKVVWSHIQLQYPYDLLVYTFGNYSIARVCAFFQWK